MNVILESPKLRDPQSNVQISGNNSSTCSNLSRAWIMSVFGPTGFKGSEPSPTSKSPPIPVVKFIITSISDDLILSAVSL